MDLIATGSDITWVKPGPLASDGLFGVETDAVWASSTDATPAYTFGSRDLSGDGRDDLVLGVLVDTASCDGLFPGGEPRIEPGPLSPGSHSVDEASIPLPTTETAQHTLIRELRVLMADVDADGQADLLSWGIDLSMPGLWWPAVFLYPGPLVAQAAPGASIPTLGYPAGAGDFNSDGTPDLLQVGAVGDSTLVVLATAPETEMDSVATVLAGPLDAAASAYPEDCTFHVAETWTPPAPLGPIKAAWVGDLDGDEVADAVLVFEGDDVRWVQVVVGGDR